jgi:pilus assembly protein CpaE
MMNSLGNGELRTLLICPSRPLAQRLQTAVSRASSFEIVEDLPGYPLPSQLEGRLRQARPMVVVIDLETDLEAALALVTAASAATPPVFIVGIHSEDDANVIIRSLRAGGTEFLSSPFEQDSIHAAVSRIRKLAETQSREAPIRGKTFGFLGVKAGQGVTTVASNVAASLSQNGKRRVLMIDFDMTGGTISFAWRVTHSYSVNDAVQHAERLDEALWGALVANRNGVDLLLSPDPNDAQGAPVDAFARLVEFTRSQYEAVVLDIPSVYSPEAKALLPACDHLLVVCNPELPSLHLTRKCIAHLEHEGFAKDQISLILNRLSRRGELGPQDMERVFNFPISKVLPEDEAGVHRALTAGKPLGESSDLGKELANLAKSLMGKAQEEKKKAAGLSLSALLSQG